MASLGIVIYLVARAAPRVGDIEESFSVGICYNKIDELIARIPLGRIDLVLSTSFEKFLLKTKLLLMKLDNLITEHIKRIKNANGKGLSKLGKPTLFEEIKEENKEKEIVEIEKLGN